MGAAAHTLGGQLRFAGSATAAAAAFYGAVVLFGPGPSSPSALGTVRVRQPQVVHVRAHAHGRVAPSPVRRRPQASAGPARQLSRRATAEGVTRRRPRRAGEHRGRPPVAQATPRSDPLASQPHPESYSAPAPASAAPPPQEPPAAAAPALPVTLPTVETPALPVSELPVGVP